MPTADTLRLCSLRPHPCTAWQSNRAPMRPVLPSLAAHLLSEHFHQRGNGDRRGRPLPGTNPISGPSVRFLCPSMAVLGTSAIAARIHQTLRPVLTPVGKVSSLKPTTAAAVGIFGRASSVQRIADHGRHLIQLPRLLEVLCSRLRSHQPNNSDEGDRSRESSRALVEIERCDALNHRSIWG